MCITSMSGDVCWFPRHINLSRIGFGKTIFQEHSTNFSLSITLLYGPVIGIALLMIFANEPLQIISFDWFSSCFIYAWFLTHHILYVIGFSWPWKLYVAQHWRHSFWYVVYHMSPMHLILSASTECAVCRRWTGVMFCWFISFSPKQLS